MNTSTLAVGDGSMDDSLKQDGDNAEDKSSSHTDSTTTTVEAQKSFFDLPAEIRNEIYKLVLIPHKWVHPWVDGFGDSIELAAFCSDTIPNNRWRTSTVYRARYLKFIQPTLTLLRTSKQINEEASPIFYGQEFRFSNRMGWQILYHWLMQIGQNNRILVRHIVVTHPGITDTYSRITDLLSSPVPLQFPGPLQHHTFPKPAGQTRNVKSSDKKKQKKWIKKSNPTLMLLDMLDLEKLELVVYAHEIGVEPPCDLHHLIEHKIHKLGFSSSSKLEVSVVNLFTSMKDPRDCIKLNHIYSGFTTLALEAQAARWGGRLRLTEDVRDAGCIYFDSIKAKGWKVEEKVSNNLTFS